MTQEYKIVSGPSREGMFLELQIQSSRQKHLRFSIMPYVGIGNRKYQELGPQKHMELWLTGIEKEDGSGESWNLSGTIENNSVKFYYNSKRRTGHIALA